MQAGLTKWYTLKGLIACQREFHSNGTFPNEAERNFAEELVDLNLRSSLRGLRNVCQDDVQSDTSGLLKILVFSDLQQTQIQYSESKLFNQIHVISNLDSNLLSSGRTQLRCSGCFVKGDGC